MTLQNTPMEAESDFTLAIRVVMMPRDVNKYGTIFGGVILSYIDQAGFIEARHHGMHRWLTASIERVDFNAPVLVGDIVGLYTRTESTGRSSVKINVRVEAERFQTRDVVPVTQASLTMVAVDKTGHSIPFDSPPTVGNDAT